ncbi:radical SAM protein [Clostridium septicum]|uniref:radical SAM protein n=1 Tax=Clostridium septicum TaxID=1504 RepID=UPI00082CCE85|nr:radical SAM protein [Clostridium septicum]
MDMIDKFEFTTYGGNEYIYFPDSNIVLGKKMLYENKERYDKLISLEGISKKEDYNIEKYYNGNDIKLKLLQSGFIELAIEVTSNCNFRCKYCIYSGNYSGQRSHIAKNMDLYTAQESIKLYLKYIKEGIDYNPNRKPVIAFYGGEPLINFDLIKQCVEYSKSLYEGEILYSITTNGSLLTDEVIDYLVKENFSVVVSLDGYKENNDRNRVNIAGHGTFDLVMKNINKLYEKQKTPVFISTVFDYKMDFQKMEDFFTKNSQLIELAINSVNPYSTNYFDQFTEADYNSYNKSLENLKKSFIDNVTDSNYDLKSFMNRSLGDICTSIFTKQINLSPQNYKVIKYTGSCIPGTKLFVDYTGDFYICEKVNREVSIGNVREGLDFEKCAEIVNIYNKVVSSKCNKCLLRNSCTRCFTSINIRDGIKIDSDVCKKIINDFKNNLTFAYSVFELNPTWIGTYFNEYYDTIKEMAVTLK